MRIKAAPASLGEFRAEMVDDVQMRHRIEPQSRLKQLPIELQELARIWCAGIGDDKPDVDIKPISTCNRRFRPAFSFTPRNCRILSFISSNRRT